MYALVFGRDNGNQYFYDYTILAVRASMEEMKEARKLSGDLVFDLKTNTIVEDDSWLFEWEKAAPECYARRKIAAHATLDKGRLWTTED